jgi:hypothetical protein
MLKINPDPLGILMLIRMGRLKDPVDTAGRDGATEKLVAPEHTDTSVVFKQTIVPVPVPGLEGLVNWGRLAEPKVFSPQADTRVISTICVAGVPS